MNLKNCTLNERIYIYRRLSGYSRSEAAKRLGISKSCYAKKERDGSIDCKLLMKMSVLFGVDVRDLLTGGGNEPFSYSAAGESPPRICLTFHDERLIRMIHSLTPDKQLKVKRYVYDLYCNQYNKH